MQNNLNHSGVKGMRWGVRKEESKTHTAKTPEQKAQTTRTIKRVAVGTATVATVATAAAIYAKNKPAVDKFVKGYFEGVKVSAAIKEGVRDQKMAQYAKTNKQTILKSAAKINKYKDYLEEDDVKNAIKKLQTTRDLHQLQQDNIKKGANYAQAFLTYTAAATTAYNLKNSSLIKDAKKKKDKDNKK